MTILDSTDPKQAAGDDAAAVVPMAGLDHLGELQGELVLSDPDALGSEADRAVIGVGGREFTGSRLAAGKRAAVVTLLGVGFTVRQIARALAISDHTVTLVNRAQAQDVATLRQRMGRLFLDGAEEIGLSLLEDLRAGRLAPDKKSIAMALFTDKGLAALGEASTVIEHVHRAATAETLHSAFADLPAVTIEAESEYEPGPGDPGPDPKARPADRVIDTLPGPQDDMESGPQAAGDQDPGPQAAGDQDPGPQAGDQDPRPPATPPATPIIDMGPGRGRPAGGGASESGGPFQVDAISLGNNLTKESDPPGPADPGPEKMRENKGAAENLQTLPALVKNHQPKDDPCQE
jgi:hypothetical protein